jgi:hypothetical protein
MVMLADTPSQTVKIVMKMDEFGDKKTHIFHKVTKAELADGIYSVMASSMGRRTTHRFASEELAEVIEDY